jgi:rRNA-processing protein FCF1
LYAALIKDNRTAELFQATQDPELQEKLMEEYGIK